MSLTPNQAMKLQDHMNLLAKKGLWGELEDFWKTNPFLLFTNEMLSYLANHMMHPDYQHEGDGLAVRLLDPQTRQSMPHLRVRGNWVLWEGIVACRNLNLVEGFINALEGEDIADAGVRLSVDKEFGEILGRVLKKRQDISQQDALVLMRRNLHDENKFGVAASAFYLLDGETYWEGLEQMTFRDSRAKAYFKGHFEGGRFLQDKHYMETVFFKTLTKYAKKEYQLCQEAMFVVFNDLERHQPHLLEQVILEHPYFRDIEILEPFVTKYLMKKEVFGVGQDGFKKKM